MWLFCFEEKITSKVLGGKKNDKIILSNKGDRSMEELGQMAA